MVIIGLLVNVTSLEWIKRNIISRLVAFKIYYFLEGGAWLYSFRMMLKESKTAGVFIIIGILGFCYSAFEIFMDPYYSIFNSNITRLYGIIVIGLSIIYFRTSLKKAYYPLFKDPNFWLCSAIILNHSLLTVTFNSFLRVDYIDVQTTIRLYTYIVYSCSAIYYSLLSCAFI